MQSASVFNSVPSLGLHEGHVDIWCTIFSLSLSLNLAQQRARTGSESNRLVENSTQNGGENMAPKSLRIPLSMRVAKQ